MAFNRLRVYPINVSEIVKLNLFMIYIGLIKILTPWSMHYAIFGKYELNMWFVAIQSCYPVEY